MLVESQFDDDKSDDEGAALSEKIDHAVFLVEDAEGNQLVVKVDKWKGSEFDPSAPATQYAAVEAYLMAEYGLDVTVTNHAVVAGSYDESGGVFLSDGTLKGRSNY